MSDDIDVERLARAMHPTLFEDLSQLPRPETLTSTEWGRLVGDVHRKRADAMREAEQILAEDARLSGSADSGGGVDTLAVLIDRAEATAEMRWHDGDTDRWAEAQRHFYALRQLADDRKYGTGSTVQSGEGEK